LLEVRLSGALASFILQPGDLSKVSTHVEAAGDPFVAPAAARQKHGAWRFWMERERSRQP
jgi:hypothetical protein